jgi:hypothetical protein
VLAVGAGEIAALAVEVVGVGEVPVSRPAVIFDRIDQSPELAAQPAGLALVGSSHSKTLSWTRGP